MNTTLILTQLFYLWTRDAGVPSKDIKIYAAMRFRPDMEEVEFSDQERLAECESLVEELQQ